MTDTLDTFADMMQQLMLEMHGQDDESKEKYYPGWTYEQLKFLFRCLQAQEI
jgi:hypothetical protein